ncbi:Protein of unknown function [Gryllus bimaculatus]|nr:Protein of unknown function [Gryllus bimaculatus]
MPERPPAARVGGIRIRARLKRACGARRRGGGGGGGRRESGGAVERRAVAVAAALRGGRRVGQAGRGRRAALPPAIKRRRGARRRPVSVQCAAQCQTQPQPRPRTDPAAPAAAAEMRSFHACVAALAAVLALAPALAGHWLPPRARRHRTTQAYRWRDQFKVKSPEEAASPGLDLCLRPARSTMQLLETNDSERQGNELAGCSRRPPDTLEVVEETRWLEEQGGQVLSGGEKAR